MDRCIELPKACNQFCAKLYRALDYQTCGFPESRSNLVFSPFSLHALLCLTGMGGRGDTRDEIFDCLNLDQTKSHRNVHFSQRYNSVLVSYLNEYKEGEEAFRVSLANRIFYTTIGVRCRLYMQFTYGYEIALFMSKVRLLDLPDFPKCVKMAKKANNWVKNVTGGKITEAVDARTLKELDRSGQLLLLSAIHFKGVWKVPFDTSKTRRCFFRMGKFKFVPVDMMSQEEVFPYCELPELDATALELPFTGDSKMSMVIILPNHYNGLFKVQNGIGSLINGGDKFWERFSQGTRVSLSMPRFKIESYFNKGMKNALQTMKINTMFRKEKSDFGAMTSIPNTHVYSLIHKALLEVSERGCGFEAEVTTISSVSQLIGSIFQENSLIDAIQAAKKFRVAHPFCFLIVDKKNDNLILLAGHVKDPTDEY